MSAAPAQDTPSGSPEQGTLEAGALKLDQLFPPAAAPAPSDKGKPAERKAKDEPPEEEETPPDGESTPPSFESELDKLLGLADEPPDPETPPEEEEETPDGAESPKEPTKFPVVNEDGSIEYVTREESRARGLRQADYTKKTQRVAERERELDTLKDGLGKDRQRYIEGLQKLETALDEPEPDWKQLQQDLPRDEYLVARDNWRAKQEARRKVQDALKGEQQKQLDEMTGKYNAYVQEEMKQLVTAIPEIRDPAFQQRLATTAAKYGFTEEQLTKVVDHRAWLLLRDAMKLHDIIAKRQELRQGAKGGKKPLVPGASGSPRQRAVSGRRKVLEAVTQARQTGDAHDAARALDALGM